MSEEEAAGWVDGLLEDSRNGVFFGACNYYSYVATRLQSEADPKSFAAEQSCSARFLPKGYTLQFRPEVAKSL